MSEFSDPKYQSFIGVLGSRLFRIPDYQRAYSWETPQINDLLSDITKLYNKPEEKKHDHHFMATIVCLNTSQKVEIGSTEFPVMQVVDGQQRLTTLIILLKIISLNLKEHNDNISQQESTSLEKLLVKDDDRLILLQTNHDSSNIFRDYLKSGKFPEPSVIATMAEKRLTDCFDICKKFVAEWNSTKEVIDLLKIIKNKLDFIFYELTDEQSVYTVFEVLNSRGLPVDSLDKCKSMLMGIIYEKNEAEISKEKSGEIHKIWSNIYREIGLININDSEILRFAATLSSKDRLSTPPSEEDSLLQIRGECELHPEKILDFTNLLYKITKILVSLSKSKRLKAVTEITHARLFAVAISLNDSLNIEEKSKVHDQWERITFLIFGILHYDSRFERGNFTRLAYDIYHMQMKCDKICERIAEIKRSYTLRITNVSEFIGNNNCYEGWENQLRYFMYQYEKYLAIQSNEKIGEELWEKIWNSSHSTTIEHICPKHCYINGWPSMGFNSDNVNFLGNLILLPQGENSRCGQRVFDEKKEIYKDSGLKLVREVLKCNQWDIDSMKKREENLIDFANSYWLNF